LPRFIAASIMMNRLLFQTLKTFTAAAAATESYETGIMRSGAEGASHAVFAPLHYEPNYAYPLIVWLHGGGDTEHQLRRVMPFISLRNYVAVAPRGTRIVPRRSGKGQGFDWLQTAEHIEDAHDRIRLAIEDAQRRFNIRADRIFFVGHACGGTMAYRIGMQQSLEIAGIVSLGGPFPTVGAPLAELNAVRSIPLFVAASRQGRFFPTEEVCDNLRLFHSAGMSITLREYPGGDGLSPQMLADVDRWIMEQIASPSATTSVMPQRQSGVN
jgi:phospholipase/carboxylesterase